MFHRIKKKTQGKGNCAEEGGGLRDPTCIRLPSKVFAWSLEQKPEGKQINILHMQVLCGV